MQVQTTTTFQTEGLCSVLLCVHNKWTLKYNLIIRILYWYTVMYICVRQVIAAGTLLYSFSYTFVQEKKPKSMKNRNRLVHFPFFLFRYTERKKFLLLSSSFSYVHWYKPTWWYQNHECQLNPTIRSITHNRRTFRPQIHFRDQTVTSWNWFCVQKIWNVAISCSFTLKSC